MEVGGSRPVDRDLINHSVPYLAMLTGPKGGHAQTRDTWTFGMRSLHLLGLLDWHRQPPCSLPQRCPLCSQSVASTELVPDEKWTDRQRGYYLGLVPRNP